MRTITNCVCLSNTYNAIAMLLFAMLQSTHLKPGIQKSYACTTTFLSEHALCICHVVKHFFFLFAFSTHWRGQYTKDGTVGNQAHTWLCEHYTPRGHSGQQRQASFLQRWFHTQQLFHVILDTAAAAIQGEHAEAHTQRNIVYKNKISKCWEWNFLSRHMD